MKYFLITIDTECDCSPDWSSSNPLSFRNILYGIPGLLQPLFGKYRAKPTYLVTTEVMENSECVNTLKNLDGEFELGTHLHGEFSSPARKYEKPDGMRTNDFICLYDRQKEFLKLEAITALFAGKFGYRPLTFRAGRFGAGPSTLRSLENLGYIADTSVTPCEKWTSSEGTVDFTRAPRQPYHPDSAGDIARAGSSGILEFPVSIYKPFMRGPRWLRPSPIVPPGDIIRVLDVLEKCTKGDVYANMMFHSMEIIPCASPYCATEKDVRAYLDTLDMVLAEAAGRGYWFVGLAQAANIKKNTEIQSGPIRQKNGGR
jgi:hypothetical protein